MNAITLIPARQQVRTIIEGRSWKLLDSALGFEKIYEDHERWMAEEPTINEEPPSFELLELDNGIETMDILKLMEARGLRPATFAEGLLFGGSQIEERPDVKTWVVLFGAKAVYLGTPIVAMLNYKNKIISTDHYYDSWTQHRSFTFRKVVFLAVRK